MGTYNRPYKVAVHGETRPYKYIDIDIHSDQIKTGKMNVTRSKRGEKRNASVENPDGRKYFRGLNLDKKFWEECQLSFEYDMDRKENEAYNSSIVG
jgi:hypothetical protein